MKKQTLEERLELYLSEKGSKDPSSNTLLLAASAVAGVGAVLVPPPAEAAIVYSGVQNKEVTVAKDQKVDIDGDGIFEFTFKMNSTYSYFTQTLSLSANGTAEVIKSNNNPARLSSNYVISSQREFSPPLNDYLAVYSGTYGTTGNFPNKPAGYLGVKFKVDGKIKYGWIQYKTENNGSKGTIIDWAYEDTPGKAIKAGDTGFNWNLFLPAILAGAKK